MHTHARFDLVLPKTNHEWNGTRKNIQFRKAKARLPIVASMAQSNRSGLRPLDWSREISGNHSCSWLLKVLLVSRADSRTEAN